MDNMGEWERKNLVNELIQGRELTKQLQSQFHRTPPLSSSSASHEMQELLIFRILLTYDKALSMLNWNYATGEPATMSGGGRGTSESPPSLGSRDMDRDNGEHEGNNNNNNNTGDSRSKRKVMPRWTKRVRVAQGILVEGQLDDGLSWRKYGQKDILGSKFPRGYYRCTHKGSQGCLATKQVQQSDEDPSVFEITYRGRHSCGNPSAGNNPPSPSPESQERNDALVVAVPPSEQEQYPRRQADLERLKDHDAILDFCKGFAMITDSSSKNPPPSFDLPSISDNSHQPHPPLGTFDFPESLTGFDLFRDNHDFRSLEHSELGLVVSAANHAATSSRTVSQTVDVRGNLDFAFGLAEFNNSFGNTGFFSK